MQLLTNLASMRRKPRIMGIKGLMQMTFIFVLISVTLFHLKFEIEFQEITAKMLSMIPIACG